MYQCLIHKINHQELKNYIRIHRCPKAQPDRGGPETDFLKITCTHACGSETHPIASESPKLQIFFEIWGVHVAFLKKYMTTTRFDHMHFRILWLQHKWITCILGLYDYNTNGPHAFHAPIPHAYNTCMYFWDTCLQSLLDALNVLPIQLACMYVPCAQLPSQGKHCLSSVNLDP